MHKIKIHFIIVISILLVFCFSLCSFAADEYVWSSSSSTVPVNATTASTQSSNFNLKFESAAAILIDQKTGDILYEHNSHEQLRPASVTKVMTILLIMEELDSGRISLDDMVPCSENAAAMGGSQIWLDVREQLSVNDMLKAICVVSRK